MTDKDKDTKLNFDLQDIKALGDCIIAMLPYVLCDEFNNDNYPVEIQKSVSEEIGNALIIHREIQKLIEFITDLKIRNKSIPEFKISYAF